LFDFTDAVVVTIYCAWLPLLLQTLCRHSIVAFNYFCLLLHFVAMLAALCWWWRCLQCGWLDVHAIAADWLYLYSLFPLMLPPLTALSPMQLWLLLQLLLPPVDCYFLTSSVLYSGHCLLSCDDVDAASAVACWCCCHGRLFINVFIFPLLMLLLHRLLRCHHLLALLAHTAVTALPNALQVDFNNFCFPSQSSLATLWQWWCCHCCVMLMLLLSPPVDCCF